MELITNNPVAIIKKDTNKEYHSNSEYIGSTTLKRYLKSPFHAKFEPYKEPTPETIFGSAYHTFVLEPEIFNLDYFVFNPEDRPDKTKTMAAKENMTWKESLISDNSGKQILSFEDFLQMEQMKEVLFKNKSAVHLLMNGEKEISHYVEFAGTKVKTRPDNKNIKFISDLKTCNDASPNGFSKQCMDFGYHLSAALYVDVDAFIYELEKPLPFNFIAQEKKAPFAISVFTASDLFIESGRNDYMTAIDRYLTAKESGNYLGYEIYTNDPNGIIQIDLPKYYYTK